MGKRKLKEKQFSPVGFIATFLLSAFLFAFLLFLLLSFFPEKENVHSLFQGVKEIPFLRYILTGNQISPLLISSSASFNLQAFHRNGQTFLTWNEAGNYFTENLNFSQYDTIRNANPGVRYRIYRYTSPINSSNLNQATRIAEVGVGTGYNFYLYGKESSDPWGSRAGEDIPRFVIQEGIGGWGSGELPLNTGLYVHTTAESSGNFYYAITLVNNSLENRTDFSSLQSPVSEVYDQNWKPILQNRSFVNETWYSGSPSAGTYYYSGDQHFFTRWEAPQLTDLASRPNNYRVVIPYNVAPPYKVDMNLHCWGSSLVSCNRLVFYSDGIYLTSTDYPPQSWWTGWNENLSFTSSQNQWTGINRYYTMHRMISFIDWMKTQWSIDNNRIMCSGWSMGGSGGKMFCLRYGNYFNYINSWAGVGVAKSSPLFNESFIGLFGSITRGILDENGFNTWDDLNMSWWLRTYPLQETPFISFSNAKNDGGIGWEQAVEFYQALRDTKRPFTFRWSQERHENHALDMSLIELSDYAGANRIDFQKNKALPAFTRFSLDNNPGNGDSVGYINAYQKWNPNTIVDQPGNFEIELWLNQSPNITGTTDVTLRNLQFFSVSPGGSFSWTLYQGASLVQQGASVADSLGLVSVPGIVLVNNTKRKLIVTTGGGSSTPTINSVNGTVAHGQNIIIGGSGFGTKTTAEPLVWDDASGVSPQQTWDFVLPDANELQYRPAYRTPSQVTNASGAIIGVPLPHNHISRYFSGAHYINLGSGGYYSSSSVVAGMNNRQGQTYSYISYYVRMSPNWFFTDMGGIGGNDHNFKEYQYDAGNGYFGGNGSNIYFAYMSPNTSQGVWGANYVEGMNVTIYSVNTNIMIWYPQFGTVFSSVSIPNIRDDWRKVEFLLVHNSSDGYHKIYHDNVLNWEVNLDDDNAGPPNNPPERSETVIGGYAREAGNSTKSKSLSNNWRYYADVYYDSSFSRVMLANDANYDLATIVEPQVPSAWSDGSVTVKVNLGRLPDTGTAYLFIFNSTNGRDVNGYAVTVSGSVPDTTPPTIPTGLTATPFSSSQINLAWNPSSDSESGVLRYNVWRDNVLVRQPSTTSVADSSLFSSTTYSYEVSAMNGAGLESARTSSVSATTLAAPDTTLPTISITTPLNGAVVNGAVTVNASASDNVGVAGVRFEVDGNQIGTEDTTAPYSRTWNTSATSNGPHVVMATARDAAGNTASANVTVTVSNSVPVDTTPPTVPANLAVTANTSYQINLSWSPSLDSESGVANYRVYRNTVLIGQPLGTSFLDATVGPGTTYLYTVAAVNLVGLVSGNSSVLSVTTPTLPLPTLAITSPIQSSIVTTRDVVVTYAESGNLSSVNHTHLQLDSQEVMDLDNDGSYTFLNVGDGSHNLSVWMVGENHTLIGSIASVNFSVAVPATPPDGGGGNTGGGGGGGASPQGPKTLKLTYLQIKSGISVEVAKDDKVEMMYENNKTYIFTLTSIDSKVVLKYGFQTATFFSGDFSELDLDGDRIRELKVMLNSLGIGKAVLYFKKIEQTGVTEPPSVKQQQEEQSSSVNQEEQPLIENVRSNGWKILTAAIILLVLVGGIAWFVARHHQHGIKNLSEEFKEQFEQ